MSDTGYQVEVHEAAGFADVSGIAVIRRAVKTLSTHPGVYRMLNTKGEVLYVGKAKNLRKRVSSYARVAGHDGRITKMIAQTAGLEIIIHKPKLKLYCLKQT